MLGFLAVSVVSLQLCYLVENDIGSHQFLKSALTLEKKLTGLINAKKSGCILLTSAQMLEEAKKLVAMDATTKTLSIQNTAE